jgi:shikimate dehydrogenase
MGPSLTSRTALFGVIGWPIAHSLSPAMQNAALAHLGIDAVYLAYAVAPARLVEAIAGASALGVLGLNVTIPHKEGVLRLCRPDRLALEVGAVNTLVFDGSSLLGLNTDVHGFRMLMAEASVPPGGRAVVLGAGGAARAVVAALRSTGWSPITVVSRRGLPLSIGGATTRAAPWEPAGLARLFAEADLVVDATPRGLDAHAEPIDLSPLPDHAAVLDLTVKRQTALTQAAQARGLKAATGVAMLLHQGGAALEAWTRRPAPIQVMRRALDAAL